MAAGVVRLDEILDRINSLFADEDFDPTTVRSWAEGVVAVLIADPKIRTQAEVNTAQQFADSPDLETAVTDAVLASHEQNTKQHEERGQINRRFFADHSHRHDLVRAIGNAAHEAVHLETAG